MLMRHWETPIFTAISGRFWHLHWFMSLIKVFVYLSPHIIEYFSKIDNDEYNILIKNSTLRIILLVLISPSSNIVIRWCSDNLGIQIRQFKAKKQDLLFLRWWKQ